MEVRMGFNYKDNAADVMGFLGEKVPDIIEEASDKFGVNPAAVMVGMMVTLDRDFRALDEEAANALVLSMITRDSECLKNAQEALAEAANRHMGWDDEDQR